jgi:hypothetical protein
MSTPLTPEPQTLEITSRRQLHRRLRSRYPEKSLSPFWLAILLPMNPAIKPRTIQARSDIYAPSSSVREEHVYGRCSNARRFYEGGDASLKILARDSQFAHHGVQGCPGQAESRGRGAHNAAVLPEDADDVFPLHLIERHAVRRFHRIRPDFPQRRAVSGPAKRLRPVP